MSFARVLRPRSIAVFGGDEAEELMRQCDAMQYRGVIWPVHPKKSEMGSRAVYRAVEELPGVPDVAYIAVNREATIQLVAALAERGAGGAVCFAAGFAEAGEDGERLQQQLLRSSGSMPLLGPNCYGLLNYIDGAMLWPDQQGGRRVERGVAIVAMSSNIAFNLVMQRRGLPVAYVVSLGNRLKFDLHDAICRLAEQPEVTAIGLYVETISDPVAFEEAVSFARRAGKPVVALKSGRSDRAQRVAMSHTAALTGVDSLASALFERTGVARVASMEALIEALKVLHVWGPLPSPRIGVMSTSGGDLVLLSDALEQTELVMPELSAEGVARITSTVHERVVVSNPLDYQMFDWNNPRRLLETTTAFVAEAFELTISVLDYPRQDRCEAGSWATAEQAFVQACHGAGRRGAIMATLSDNMDEATAHRLLEQNVIPLLGIEHGLAGVDAACRIGRAWATAEHERLLQFPSFAADRRPIVLDEARSKRLLACYRVPVPKFAVVESTEDAVAAAVRLGFPVTLKALGIAHKSDVGGVELNLRSGEAVASAMTGMSGLADSFMVEEMIADPVAELLVGVVRDPKIGPYLVVGAGGALVELLEDRRLLLLPIHRGDVLDALGTLRCAPLLRGFRGGPAADLDAAAAAIMKIAAFAQAHSDELVELDVNPLLVCAQGHGAYAADALISIAEWP